MSEVDQAELAALIEQLGAGSCDWTDTRVPALIAWLRAGRRRSELQALLRSTQSRLHTLPAAHALPLIALLTDLELTQLACALSALPQLARDPDIAAERARLAMQLRDYSSAIAASERAVTPLLQPGVSLDELLRLCVAGAPAEGLLRFERHVLAAREPLSQRLALRWEALHRAGRRREASLMQLMCQRYFPERASVWATAGNHALDCDDLEHAEQYFRRCLQLDPRWPAGLAGLAIVYERRKDWPAALPYRRRVLEVSDALNHEDAASLQRRLRYAAALARLGQWQQAEPLFRGAARAPASAQLPAERPVLLRVFSRELYAPALASALSGTQHEQDPAVALAVHEARLLGQLQLQLSAAGIPPRDERWALGLCAYLSGELERAYELFDQVELDRPDDVAVHYLLWRCASAVGHEQARSIRTFAEQAARTLWAQHEPAHPDQLSYAIAILPELAGSMPASVPAAALEQLAPVEAPWLAQLERLVAFRVSHHAAGHSPLIAAAASSHVLAALTT